MRSWKIRRPTPWLCGLVVAGGLSTETPAQGLIGFERSHPEIVAFRRKHPGGESVVSGRKVPALALPVLDFTYPAVVGLGGFESGAAPETVREAPVYDPRDPTTYSVRHIYGDVTIVVTADLNIQSSVDAKARAIAPDNIEVEVAQRGDPELPAIARVTLYKFGIPYTIDIECGHAHAALCRNAKQLRALAERLALVSVPKK